MEYFFTQMREILGAEYDEFESAFKQKPRFKALRVNTLKISIEKFREIYGALTPNPLCDTSFYTDIKPSKDPLYHAGLYYMQEPSAAAAVAAFAPFIGERVLDLCAAPGGKATQVAAYMNGKGVLFCNESEYKRAAALAENVARLGVRNAVVTHGTARDYIAAQYSGFFDTLIVDAPCSGGGMMRYERVPYDDAIVNGCAERQRTILKDAVDLLSAGGHMLYSTCTFAPQENERNIEFLLSLGLEAVDIPLLSGVERGIGISPARRIYPHKFDGEGHFYCVLKKHGDCAVLPRLKKSKQKRVSVCGVEADACVVLNRVKLPIDLPDLFKLNIVSAGVDVFSKNDEPSYAFTHAVDASSVERMGIGLSREQALSYLRGEELKSEECGRGYKIALYRGYALGAVKSSLSGNGDTVLKNLYPKKLRLPPQ